MERDYVTYVSTMDMSISTHTLTWSVTFKGVSQLKRELFQLTRSRGAWPFSSMLNAPLSSFQLTRSRGAWHPQLWPYNRQRYFNSHAHVERDKMAKFLVAYNKNFNSHAHVERDPKYNSQSSCVINFNSHAHVERDMPSFSIPSSDIYFNSHAHVERDSP